MQLCTHEEQLIKVLRSFWVRHPSQLNDAFTADAELVRLSDDLCLACTTDTLHEEITLGILKDPWTIGWTAVAINLSDLAAVGAEPRGILLAWTIPSSMRADMIEEIARGVADAANAHKTALLGGDLNSGASLQICGSAFGVVPNGKARQRVGINAGDRIFVTGPLGIGNALGLSRLQKLDEARSIEERYRPTARFDAGPIVREFATACIDTSDGLLASLDILSRLNSCGIVFRHKAGLYHRDARDLASRYAIPLWLFAAAEHGEFELVFSVPRGRVRECLDYCADCRLTVMEIGEAVESPGLFIKTETRSVAINLSTVRGLSSTIREDPHAYIRSILEYSRTLGIPD